jgi:hypothetical protein
MGRYLSVQKKRFGYLSDNDGTERETQNNQNRSGFSNFESKHSDFSYHFVQHEPHNTTYERTRCAGFEPDSHIHHGQGAKHKICHYAHPWWLAMGKEQNIRGSFYI